MALLGTAKVLSQLAYQVPLWFWVSHLTVYIFVFKTKLRTLNSELLAEPSSLKPLKLKKDYILCCHFQTFHSFCDILAINIGSVIQVVLKAAKEKL